ncbi:MAG: sugar phosphate isomerase/epimerase [Ruminococcaceae bacterium]|nr:sugar phosphate isomerase/epimerase [Oscillospiraceae bacterium]
MELSIGLDYLKKTPDCMLRTTEQAAKICKEGGISYVDYLSPVTEDNWEELAHKEAEMFSRVGIRVHQSHAPFNRYSYVEEELFQTYMLRSVEAARILGATYLVIHGDEYNTFPRDTQDAHAWSKKFFSPIADLAAKKGITLAFENVFEDDNRGRKRYTSSVEDLIALTDSLNCVCCWDYGHGRVQYKDKDLLALKQIGSRLACTHVHDSYYGSDLHVPPFFGQIDWKSHMEHLKEINYSGMLSFEPVYGQMPDELVTDYLRFMKKIGDVLKNYDTI